MKINMLLLCCCLLQNLLSASQASQHVIISGQIKGETNSVSHIGIYYFNKYISITDNSRLDTSLLLDKTGGFSLCLPDSIGKIGQLVVFFKSTNNNDGDLIDNYVVEPGDSVCFEISVENHEITNITINGKGQVKYKCRTELIMQRKQIAASGKRQADSTVKAMKNGFSFSRQDAWENGIRSQREAIERAEHILEKYEDKINSYPYKIMQADLIGEYYGALERKFQIYYEFIFDAGDAEKEEAARHLIAMYEPHIQLLIDEAIAMSPDYLDFIMQKEIVAISLSKKITWKTVVMSFSDLFEQVNKTYAGELRERLLMGMLVDANQNHGLIADREKREKYLRETMRIIKNPSFLKSIQEAAIYKVRVGSDAFDFKLPDTSGKMVSLSDLKNSVVIMDMWFTGCGGCVQFAEKMKTEVLPAFRGNSVLKIVSINTDPAKGSWLRSISTGKYTSGDNINLQSQQPTEEAKSFSDIPLVAYYGVNYVPFILLIDKNGRIAAQFSNTDTSEFIISKVRAVINED